MTCKGTAQNKLLHKDEIIMYSVGMYNQIKHSDAVNTRNGEFIRVPYV